MPYTEDQLLPISALQHLLFCERQCALIHIEQVWEENSFTAEGQVLHKRAHEGPDERRPGIRITRGLPVRSLELGLSGACDVVEFHESTSEHGASNNSENKATGGGTRQRETILPVEYKRGKPKAHRADEVQLCAQALCLEEMLGLPIPHGALYYGERHRRTEVAFDEPLRALTRELCARLRVLIDSRTTPPAVKERKCESCSLIRLCMPEIFTLRRGVGAWFTRQMESLPEA